MTVPDHGICERTGKRRYTRRNAKAQASWWRRFRFARMHYYQCKSCGAYHIGNQTHRPKARAR